MPHKGKGGAHPTPARLAHLDRALASEARGDWFDPSTVHQFIERSGRGYTHLFRMQATVSSNLTLSTFFTGEAHNGWCGCL